MYNISGVYTKGRTWKKKGNTNLKFLSTQASLFQKKKKIFKRKEMELYVKFALSVKSFQTPEARFSPPSISHAYI